MMAAPSAASAVAMPRPMPLVEPVTTATLPFNMSNLLVFHLSFDGLQRPPRNDARDRAGTRHQVERLDDHRAGGRIGRDHQHGMAVEHRRRKVGGAGKRASLQGADRVTANAVVLARARG